MLTGPCGGDQKRTFIADSPEILTPSPCSTIVDDENSDLNFLISSNFCQSAICPPIVTV